MKYVKLQTGYYQDPKVLGLSDGAEVLFIRSIAYAGAAETSGYIPRAWIPHGSRMIDARSLHKLCKELTSCALWTEVDGGFQINRWHENQPEAEKLLDQRKAAAERQRKHRAGKTKPAVDKPSETGDVTGSVTRDLARAREMRVREELTNPLVHLVRRHLFGDAHANTTTTDEDLLEVWSGVVGTADLDTELRAWLVHNAGTNLRNPGAALLGWLRTAAARAAAPPAPGCDACIGGWAPDEFGQPSERRCTECRPHLKAVND